MRISKFSHGFAVDKLNTDVIANQEFVMKLLHSQDYCNGKVVLVFITQSGSQQLFKINFCERILSSFLCALYRRAQHPNRDQNRLQE